MLSGFDKTPSCIILPTGKEFKLQIRYTSGRHPLQSFDAGGACCGGLVQHTHTLVCMLRPT